MTANAAIEQVEADDEDIAPNRAMRVAHALARKDGDEFAKPGKLVEIHFVKGQSLSLTASRLLALMILTAGGDAWRDTTHRMRKADIRRGHKGNERIADMLIELHQTLFSVDDRSWRGKKATRRFPLIASSREEAEDGDEIEAGWIEWQFTADARQLIQESETYAVLNRQAVLGFRSNYALRLYEMGALRIHRRQSSWKGDVTALRAALGIAPDIYKDFAQLRRKVLEVAKAEIDQLAHFRVEWREIRKGRKIADIELMFVAKDAPEQIDTADELDRHSAGRKARREGSVEQISVSAELEDRSKEISGLVSNLAGKLIAPDVKAEKARAGSDRDVFARFPRGRLHFGVSEEAFREIGRAHGGGWDVDVLAEAFRDMMGERLDRLSGSKLRNSWKGFCESYAARKGRP